MVLEGSLSTSFVCEGTRKIKKVIYNDVKCAEYMYMALPKANQSRILGNANSLRSQVRAYEAVVSGETPLTDAEINDAVNH